MTILFLDPVKKLIIKGVSDKYHATTFIDVSYLDECLV